MGVGTFAGSVPVEVGSWINQSLTERGYDITNPDDIKRAYSNSTLMAEIRGEAERKGVTTASVDALFSAFGGKIATGGVGGSLARRAGRVATDIGVQAAGEAVSEGAGQLAAYGGDTKRIDVGEVLLEGLSSFGQSAATTAMGVAGSSASKIRERYSKDPVKAAGEIVTDAKGAMEAVNVAENLVKISDAVETIEVLLR